MSSVRQSIIELADFAGERGIKLSVGEKQRISIARALLSEPRVLVLDEATAFLDMETEERVTDAIRVLRSERTILIVSHRLSAIRHAALIIAHERGGLAYQGCFEDFARTTRRFPGSLLSQS